METAAASPLPEGRFPSRRRLGLVLLLLCSAAGAAEPDAPPPAPVASLVQADAAPLHAVRVFRVYGWHGLDAHDGVIWLGVDEPYLVGLRTPCRAADGNAPLTLVVRSYHLVAGRDRLNFPAGSCTIDSLWRGDRNKLRASSIGPDPAAAIRVVDEARAGAKK